MLFRLSLPLMNGVPKAMATSRHASAVRTSAPSTSGSLTFPQQKLSRMAMRDGSAPTATTFRTASSMAAAAIQYPLGTMEAMEFLMDKVHGTKTNQEFLQSMNR